MTLERNGVTKKQARSKTPRYKVWVRPAVHSARKRLPGHVRQRIKRTIDDLSQTPRPAKSRVLRLSAEVDSSIKSEWEVRRIRLEDWRVVYAINETWQEIAVLTVQRRPPYDYEDLEILLSELW